MIWIYMFGTIAYALHVNPSSSKPTPPETLNREPEILHPKIPKTLNTPSQIPKP